MEFVTRGSLPSHSTWNNQSILSVNTNGIKKNGQLLIQHILSTHTICCIQDTRYRDRQHLETFRFHLASTSQNNAFVSDTNGLHSHPVRKRINDVMTIIRMDLPGFEAAEALNNLSV